LLQSIPFHGFGLLSIFQSLIAEVKVNNPHDLWIDSYAKAVLEPFGLANRCRVENSNSHAVAF